jgi:hypothetical protein
LRKASGFLANADPSSSSAPAGRLSLPAGAEEVLQELRLSERQSLSANQAAQPQIILGIVERNSDKPVGIARRSESADERRTAGGTAAAS